MRRVLSFALVTCMAGAVLACSGSSPSTPSPGQVNLVIAGLSTSFPGSTCTREFPGNRGAAGTTLLLTFTYSAPQGNVTGGNIQLVQTYSTGDTETHMFAIPSEFVTMTGTTLGTIRVGGCPRYNDATGSMETLTLFDAAGHTSNSLTVSVTKPAGAL